MPFYVGYTSSAASIWNTNNNSGNVNSSIYPATNTPETDLPPLPEGYMLTELWAYLDVSGSHHTKIDLGVIDINTGTTSTKPLLYSASVALDADGPGGIGWQWVGVTNLDVDFSSHAGKRMAAAMGRPHDGQRVQFRFASVSPTGGWLIGSRGSQYNIPSPWPSGGSAEHVSLYAVFDKIPTRIRASTEAVAGTQMRVVQGANGSFVRIRKLN